MIDKIGEVMLYVNDLEDSKAYWTDILNFKVIGEEIDDPVLPWVKIAPKEHSETAIVLMDKAIIAKTSPELNLETPSLIFFQSPRSLNNCTKYSWKTKLMSVK